MKSDSFHRISMSGSLVRHVYLYMPLLGDVWWGSIPRLRNAQNSEMNFLAFTSLVKAVSQKLPFLAYGMIISSCRYKLYILCCMYISSTFFHYVIKIKTYNYKHYTPMKAVALQGRF